MTTNPAENPTPPQPQPQPQPSQPPAPGTVPAPQDVSKDDRNMAMLAHLLSIFGFIPSLVIWLMKKQTSPFVEDQAREALNWEITVGIGMFACGILTYIPIVGCVMSLAALGIWIANAVFCIKGAMTATNGIAYRYPSFGLRLVK
jgi:uncharacterized protein